MALAVAVAACASPSARHPVDDASSDLAMHDGADDRDAPEVTERDAKTLTDVVADVTDTPIVTADAPTPDAPDATPPCTTGVRCGSACVDTDTAVAHCGTCGRVCEARPGATAACEGGTCTHRCDEGRADCDRDALNGCEARITDDPLRCGRCDARCEVAHGTPGCSAGRCTVARCDDGYQLVSGECRVIAAPRLRSPLSGMQVASRNPMLRWFVGAGNTASVVEVCRDAAMSMGCVTATTTAAVYRPEAPLAPGMHFWRVRGRDGEVTGMTASRTWEFFVGQNPSTRPAADGVGSPYVDWDADGRGDLVVGAPGYDPTTQGRFWSWQGAPWSTMPPSRMAWDPPMGTQTNFGGKFGAGDFDRDGFTDLAVGRWVDGDRVHIFSGGIARWSTMIRSLRVFPRPTGDAGDFGRTLTACDLDGDGYQDLVVGSAGLAGRAYIYRGGSSGLTATATTLHLGSGAAGIEAGALYAVGDLDDDGYCDAVATLSPPDVPVRRVGETRVYRGSASGLEPTWTTLSAPGVPFFDNARGGDVDGDGFTDLVLGCYGDRTTYGYAAVFRGRGADIVAPAPIVVSAGPTGSAFSAQLVVTDVNGDGRADVIAGVGEGTNLRLYAYHGRVGGPATMPSATVLVSPLAGANYITAYAVSDLDGDGYNEVAVGYGITPSPGVVLIFAGGPSGLSATPRWVLHGSMSRDSFGIVVAARNARKATTSPSTPGPRRA